MGELLKRIVVNKHLVKKNLLHGTDDPVLSVQTSRGVERAHEVEILGPSTLVTRPDKPLGCGATVWIQTRSPIKTKLRTAEESAAIIARRSAKQTCKVG